ncbi:tetratricopeptide repeat protein [Arthrobacter sp. JZ12]|uniref:tetratricopeptide repeat protein n=1 Tax=Arthrobacter sp. JZ12 TaxID=2654190 RepID=UPI002B461AF3|nr:tetratricopeptide repeat protein [Arthrobacter sp. JZ12]WRH25237.1 tetratricopeptide repeat protein [Arthrobacter sp. JZ12]
MTTPNTPGGAAPSSMNLRGAVDLSTLKARAQSRETPGAGPGGPASAGGGSPFIVDVTEQVFPQLVQLSAQVPVIVAIGASWSEQSAQVLAVLEALAVEQAGRILLARVDFDGQPGVAQAFGAQGVPTVVGILKGQPVPLFEGVLAEPQVRSYLEELLKVAQANGVTGSLNNDAQGAGAQEPADQPLPPLHQEAFDAIEAGDYAAAAAAYRKALAEQPADQDAKAGLAQVELMERLRTADATAVRTAAAESPDSVEAQLAVADLDLSGGHVEDAFARLTGFIARSSGEDRETARVRLLELFDIVGPTDPRVNKARSALARALF